MLSTPPKPSGNGQRQLLLNLKCLFWCVHEARQQYNLNLTMHSLDRRVLHPEIENSHLGENLHYLLETLDNEDLQRVKVAMRNMSASRSSIEVGQKHFEIGHYIQASEDFGPIAEGSYGIICSITPKMRGLFVVEDTHLMESVFAPSKVRTIFGTYVV